MWAILANIETSVSHPPDCAKQQEKAFLYQATFEHIEDREKIYVVWHEKA